MQRWLSPLQLWCKIHTNFPWREKKYWKVLKDRVPQGELVFIQSGRRKPRTLWNLSEKCNGLYTKVAWALCVTWIYLMQALTRRISTARIACLVEKRSCNSYKNMFAEALEWALRKTALECSDNTMMTQRGKRACSHSLWGLVITIATHGTI